MRRKHICNLTCNICGKELTTGWRRTKIGRWFKKKIIIREHYHTKAEVSVFDMFGIYMPTTKRNTKNG